MQGLWVFKYVIISFSILLNCVLLGQTRLDNDYQNLFNDVKTGISKSLFLNKANRLNREALSCNDYWTQAALWKLKGIYYAAYNDPIKMDSATFCFEKGFALIRTLSCATQRQIEIKTTLLHNLSNVYLEDFDKAIKYSLASIDLYDKHKMTEKRDLEYITLSNIFFTLGDFENMGLYLEKAKISFLKNHNTYFQGGAGGLYLYSIYYAEKMELDSSKKYYVVANQLVKSHNWYNSEHNLKYLLLIAKAQLFSRLQKSEKSLLAIQTSMNVTDNSNPLHPFVSCLYASILIQNKRHTEAFLTLNSLVNTPNIKKSIFHYERVLKLLSKYDKSTRTFKPTNNYIDELYETLKEKYQKSYAEKVLEYENKRMSAEVVALKKDLSISNLTIENESKNRLIFKLQLFGIFFISIVILVIISLVLWNRNRLIKNRKALVKMTEEVAKYKGQLKPHFIFNCLTRVQSSLLDDDLASSQQLIVEYSKLFRSMLNNLNYDLITLQEEINFISLYITVESKAFTKPIHLILELDEAIDISTVLIPPILLQPFIENSIRHGKIEEIHEPTITLKILKISNQILQIQVKDNGKGFKTEQRSTSSKGLSISEHRIKLALETKNLGQFHNFTIYSDQEGTLVQFNIAMIDRYEN